MAIRAETLITEFRGETRDLDRAFATAERRTEEHVRRVNSRLAQIGREVGRMAEGGGFLPGVANITGIIAGLPQIGNLAASLVRPLTDAAEAGVRFNAFLETSAIGFTTMMGSAERAQKHLNELADFASRTPFQFRDLVDASRKMQAFGFTAQQVIPTLTAVGNAMSAAGITGGEALERVVRQLGQIQSIGRLGAEEMRALADNGIPAWEMLAQAIGKTVEETRRLSEAGRLRGREGVQILLEQMNRRFPGAMQRMEGTLTQRLSNLQDLFERAGGMATQGLTRDISETLGAGLQQGDLVSRMAQGINTAISPVSGMIRTAAVGLLGGSLVEGLIEGVTAGRERIQAQMYILGGGVVSALKSAFGINTPARETIPIGAAIDEGIALGIRTNAGVIYEAISGVTRGAVSAGLSAVQGRGRARGVAFERGGFTSGDADIDRLIREQAQRTGVPAELLFAQLLQESGFRTHARSPVGAQGIAQFMPGTARRYGLSNPNDPAQAIRAQADYMRDLLRMFGGNESHALAGYNAGEGRVRRYGGIPPFAETQNYVRSIMGTVNAIRGDRLDVQATTVYLSGDIRMRTGEIHPSGYGPAVDNPRLAWDRPTVTGRGITLPMPRGNNLGFATLPPSAGLSSDPFFGLGPPPDMAARVGELTRQQQEANFKRLVMQGNNTWIELRQGFESVFTDAFSSIEGGFKGMTGRFLIGFSTMLQQMALQALAANLGKMIFGNMDAQGGGSGGWLQKIFGVVIGALGGGIGGGGSLGQSVGGGGLQHGGPARAGMLYETHGLGKREWFIPSTNGQVVTREQMQGNTTVINFNYTPRAADNYVQKKSQREIWDGITGYARMRAS